MVTSTKHTVSNRRANGYKGKRRGNRACTATMRGALSMLAIAMAAHSCAAFAPAPALGLVRRLPAPSALRAPLAKLHMKLYTRSKDNLIRDRLKKSLEFAGSKVFPAGAGWQAASVFAGDLGLASTSLAFCLLVGIGNLLGVFIGHSFSTFWVKTFYKEAATNNLNNEMQVATLLGGAAFFSGAIHQPALNAMHGYGFGASFLGVGVACSFAFFFALRALRALLSWRMVAAEPPNP